MSALAERLAPVQDALAELERDYREQARAGAEPETWAAWADLHAALMAVRAAQGRDARAGRGEGPRYRPPVALPDRPRDTPPCSKGRDCVCAVPRGTSVGAPGIARPYPPRATPTKGTPAAGGRA